jgi:hypothetical protein
MSKPTASDSYDGDAEDAKQQAKDMAMLKSHAVQLAEHFDSVQIICTRGDGDRQDCTIGADYGQGNWYARVGSVQDWLKNVGKK